VKEDCVCLVMRYRWTTSAYHRKQSYWEVPDFNSGPGRPRTTWDI